MSELLQRTRVLTAAVILAGGALACSDTTDEARAIGYAHVQEAKIIDQDWFSHTRETRLPEDRPIRNIDDYLVKTGSICASYNSDGTCSVSMPIFDTRYDYESFDPYVHHECNPEIDWDEFPNTRLQTDEACFENREPDQWLEIEPDKFLLRISIPRGDDKDPLICERSVSEEQFHASRNQSLTLTHRGCNIRSFKINTPDSD
jgi:hypothetical protein